MENVLIDIRQYEKYHVGRYLQKEFKKDLVSVEDLIGTIEELLADNEHLLEKYEDLVDDLEGNYRPLSRSDYTGDSYDDNF